MTADLTKPGVFSIFRAATVGDYIEWFEAWSPHSLADTDYYDYPFNRRRWLYALGDFTMLGECGAFSVDIIVPAGVRPSGDQGHNRLFRAKGEGRRPYSVPVFSDPEFLRLPGMAEWIEERRAQDVKQRQERDAEHEKRARLMALGDIGRFPGGGQR